MQQPAATLDLAPPPLFSPAGGPGLSRGGASSSAMGRHPGASAATQSQPSQQLYRYSQGATPPPPLFSAAPVPVPIKDRTTTSMNDALKRPEVVGILMGLLTCFCMTVLPVLGGASLLRDPNYRFWKGYYFPLIDIVTCVSVLLVATVTAYILYRRAHRQDLNEATMVTASSVFSAMMGVSLLLVSVQASQGLNSTANTLMQGCSAPLHDVHLLSDYRQVLANIKAGPNCAGEMSVESCEGYSENKYTSYLRYLEQEFECGPVCSSPTAANFQHERWGLVQMSANTADGASQQEAGGSGDGSSTASAEVQAEEDARSAGSHALRKRNTPRQLQPALMPDGPKPPEAVDWGHVTTSSCPNCPRGTSTTEAPPPYWKTLQGPAGREPPGAASGFSPKLFSLGYTRTSCLPLVSTRLKVLAYASNDIPFYEGCGLVFISLTISIVALLQRVFQPRK